MIDKWLLEVEKAKGSDLHLYVGQRPIMRVDGKLIPLNAPALNASDIEGILKEKLNDMQLVRYKKSRDLDLAIENKLSGTRYRTNVFGQGT